MNLKKQIMSYASVNVLNASIPFFFLPILTSYLLPADYGKLSMIQLLISLILPVILLNIQGLINIEYSRNSVEEFKNLIGSSIWLVIFSFVILEVLFYIFSGLLSKYFHVDEFFIYLIPFFVLLQSIPTMLPAIYQAKQVPIKFGRFKIGITIANVLLSILFVVYLKLGWTGRLYGIIGAFILFTILGLYILFKENLLVRFPDKNAVKKILFFGLPLIPHALSGIFLGLSGRFFLANFKDSSAVGIYSVSFQVASVLSILMTSINQAWVPHLFGLLNKKPTIETKTKIVKQTYILIAGIISVFLLYVLISPIVFKLFVNKSYYEGINLLFFLGLAFSLQGVYFLFANYIMYVKRNKYLSYTTFLSAVIVSISNICLIGKYGLMASGYSLVIAWSFQLVFTMFIASRVYEMPWLFLFKRKMKSC